MKKNENKKESKKKIIYVFIIIGIIGLVVKVFILNPIIERAKVNKICSTYGEGWYAVKNPFPEDCKKSGVNCKIYKWSCCSPTGDKNLCVHVDYDEY